MHDTVKTTTLIEIRDFLATEGCAPPPWGPPERAVDALYRLLRERRGDDRFWADLAELTRRLDDRRFDPAPLSEVLGATELDRLIADLRRSLDGAGAKPSALAWIGSAASASALVAFLLLGAAAGCDNGPSDGDGDVDADVEPDADVVPDAEADAEAEEPCAEAVARGYTGEVARVYCDLIEVIQGSTVAAGVKTDLLACLPELDAALRASLIEQFATMNDTDLATYLTGMFDPGEPCFEDAH